MYSACLVDPSELTIGESVDDKYRIYSRRMAIQTRLIYQMKTRSQNPAYTESHTIHFATNSAARVHQALSVTNIHTLILIDVPVRHILTMAEEDTWFREKLSRVVHLVVRNVKSSRMLICHHMAQYFPALQSLRIEYRSGTIMDGDLVVLDPSDYRELRELSMPMNMLSILARIPDDLEALDLSTVMEVTGHRPITRRTIGELVAKFTSAHTLMVREVDRNMFRCIGKMTQLRYLDVVMRDVTNEIPVSKLVNLECLSVRTAHGFSRRRVPKTYLRLPRLNSLRLVSSVPMEVADEFDKIRLLKRLHISVPRGPLKLPRSLNRCKSLVSLELHQVWAKELVEWVIREHQEAVKELRPCLASKVYPVHLEMGDMMDSMDLLLDTDLREHKTIFDSVIRAIRRMISIAMSVSKTETS